jgi:hypothetical protein
MSETTTAPTHVEMKFEGVENTIQVPAARVERYKARGWKPVSPAQAKKAADAKGD